MNREETVRLLAEVRRRCPRMVLQEGAPQDWERILGRYPGTQVQAAVERLTDGGVMGVGRAFVDPQDVDATVREIRAKLLAHVEHYRAYPPPAVVDAPAAVELRWWQHVVRRIGDGEDPHVVVPDAIPVDAHDRSVAARVRDVIGQGLGRQLPRGRA